jgi:hypothetical protein
LDELEDVDVDVRTTEATIAWLVENDERAVG